MGDDYGWITEDVPDVIGFGRRAAVVGVGNDSDGAVGR